MRVTLTDDGCTYEGDTTPAPGIFNIEVENETSHFATFTMWALATGKNLEDVQHVFGQGKEPKPGKAAGLFAGGVADATADPDGTSVMPVDESRGRFVIGCWVHT